MALYKEDKPSAFIGLIAGAIALLILVFGMVQITNAKFEGHQASPGAEAGH